MSRDIIYGIHSIVKVLSNKTRENIELYLTEEGMDNLVSKSNFSIKKIKEDSRVTINLMSSSKLQVIAQQKCADLGVNYNRVPSQVFCICDSLLFFELSDIIFDKTENLKILILDGITDVHNMGAIYRTASFYGVSYILFARKGDMQFSPSFFRICSGAFESIKSIKVSNLSKAITKLVSSNVSIVALSEHSSSNIDLIKSNISNNPIALVLGEEEKGISNAVKRIVETTFSINSLGDIKSLNVSVAAAVAMEKLFT